MFKVVLDLDDQELKELIVQTAACVIAFCRQWREGTSVAAAPAAIGDIDSVLAEHLPESATTRYDRASGVLSQASFVFDWVEMMLQPTAWGWHPAPGEIELIAAALHTFEDWKNAFVATAPSPVHWGTETSVARRNWGRLNERFVTRYSSRVI